MGSNAKGVSALAGLTAGLFLNMSAHAGPVVEYTFEGTFSSSAAEKFILGSSGSFESMPLNVSAFPEIDAFTSANPSITGRVSLDLGALPAAGSDSDTAFYGGSQLSVHFDNGGSPLEVASQPSFEPVAIVDNDSTVGDVLSVVIDGGGPFFINSSHPDSGTVGNLDFNVDFMEFILDDASAAVFGNVKQPATLSLSPFTNGSSDTASVFLTLKSSFNTENQQTGETFTNIYEFDLVYDVTSLQGGAAPGTVANPYLPVASDGGSSSGGSAGSGDGFVIPFDVSDVEQTIFIDPKPALGYDYQLDLGINPDALFASVLLPDVGDGLYELYLFDDSIKDFVKVADLVAGVAYNFGGNGVSLFRILGIEASAGLDPTDPSAFVTGLTFTHTGTVQVTQTPVTATVPEPATLALFGVGLFGLGAMRSRRRAP